MNKSRIFWLHSHFQLSTGGTRFIFEVVSRLKKEHQVCVVVETTSPEWRAKFAAIGVEVIELLPTSSYSLFYWLTWPLWMLISVIKILRLIPSEATVITSMFPLTMISLLHRYKVIQYCFEPYAFFYDQELIRTFPFLKRWAMQVLALVLIPLDFVSTKKADVLLGINPSVGKWIRHVYHRQPDYYSYLGVDLSHFKKVRTRPNAVFKLFHSTDYTSLKGTWFLLRALEHLATVPFHLYVSETTHNSAEKNQMLQYLANHDLKDRVTFLGHIEYKDLPYWYSWCDVYCFTGDPKSRGATAASLSVLEAAACQMPVIRSIGNDDEVIDGKTGFLVNSRNPLQIATSLIALASDKKLKLVMGNRAAAHVSQRYTWEKVNLVFEEVLKNFTR